MPRALRSLRSRLLPLTGLALVMAGLQLVAPVAATANPGGTHLVINEYSGGNGTGTAATDEYVELYNPTSQTITFTGTIQYKSASGSTYTAVGPVTTFVVPAHGYWLVAGINYSGAATPDSRYSFDGSASTTGGGHIALTGATTGVTTPASDPLRVDLLGFGTANTPEGTAAPNHPFAGGSLRRTNGRDTDNNSVDFVQSTTRSPRSSTSPSTAMTDPGSQTWSVGTAITPVVVRASGGRAPYTYAAVSDPLPDGVTLSSTTGELTGTPTAARPAADVTVRATDANGEPSFRTFSIAVAGNVQQVPSITSPNTAHFNVGQAGSFTITTAGDPTPAITRTGTLPHGLTFTDNGDGTATIAGTPTGSGGTFPLSLTANNGVSPHATQTLTLTVGQPPAFTSASTATFRVGQAGSFTVTTSGIPTVSTITESGTLPAGVSFTDNGDGTATVAGTPTWSGNTYPVTLTATNGVNPNATQNLTIQVNQAPSVTTNPVTQTARPGTPVTFTAAASGVPTPTVQWQRDEGAGFVNIAGATSTTYTFTAAASNNGLQYRAVFSNGSGAASTTPATLSVGEAPAFTSADQTSFVVGSASSFSLSTTGTPTATLSRTGAQFPVWLTLTDNGDGTGTLTGTPPLGSGGQYQFTLKAANGFSPSASQTFTLSVDAPPKITSTDRATYTVGAPGVFTLTTTAGHPSASTITKTGALPAGLTFTDMGDGTAILAGTPADGTGGVYPLTFTAGNGVGSGDTQGFTLTVNEGPRLTSGNEATFRKGVAGAFTVTTNSGHPSAVTLTSSGSLPGGVSFVDNGDGTATLAGTPTEGGSFPLRITASNGVQPDASQSFTLTVEAPPVITSADHAVFSAGVAGSFTVTSSAGVPSATTLTSSGSLPGGVSFTDNGDGTATIAGTPATGTGGAYDVTITASNGIGPDSTQSFTLTVNEGPRLTSNNETTFRQGVAGSFTVTTAGGHPSTVTLTSSGSLPGGVSFTDNGDGTATLAGTPDEHGTFALELTASNGVQPDAVQDFTLTVQAPPRISSADHTTFAVGEAGSFTVTTAGGTPASTELDLGGDLPSGVAFIDNGDGTATLAGTPDEHGTFPLQLVAANGVQPDAEQDFTLTVTDLPAITSADHATFTQGKAGTFTVEARAGFPAATTLTATGALPAGVAFTDNGDGTGTISGTPTAGGGTTFTVTLTATNPAGSTEQAFRLTVDQEVVNPPPTNPPPTNPVPTTNPSPTTDARDLALRLRGVKQVGRLLRATLSPTPAPGSDVVWSWYVGGELVPGASGASYRTSIDDLGKRVVAQAQVTEPGRAATAVRGTSGKALRLQKMVVTAQQSTVERGGSVTITATHLRPGQSYVIRFGNGRELATGTVPEGAEQIRRTIELPRVTALGVRTLVVETWGPHRSKAVDVRVRP